MNEHTGYLLDRVAFFLALYGSNGLASGASFSSAAAAEPAEAAADEGSTSGDGIAKGLGIEKGADDPVMIPIEELPSWVAELAQPKMTLGQLQRAEEDSLTIDQVHAPS